MKKLLIVVDSPGSADFIAPVIPLLQKKVKIAIVTVNTSKEAPYTLLKHYKPLRCDQERDADHIYHKINPDILLVGTSSLLLGPFVNNKFIALAKKNAKRIVVFQDYWANHRWPQNKETLHLWDTVLVPDEFAKKLLVEDGKKETLIVTGNPAFDAFKTTAVSEKRKTLREELNIQKDEFVVLYAGCGTPQAGEEDDATFRFLATVLQEFMAQHPGVVLIPRAHPRDEVKNRYQTLAPRLPMYDPNHGAITYTTDTLLPLADCIISAYSTILIHSCIARIPAISILLPDSGRRHLRTIGLDNFPTNTIGASIGIYKESPKELTAVLAAIKDDARFRGKIKSAQEQFFPTDNNKKSATETVADTILSLIQEKSV